MYTVITTNRKSGKERQYTRVVSVNADGENAILTLHSINEREVEVDPTKWDITLSRHTKSWKFASMAAFLYKLNHTNDEEFVTASFDAAINAVEKYRSHRYLVREFIGDEHNELAATMRDVEDDWYSTPSPRDYDSSMVVVKALINLVAVDLPGYLVSFLAMNGIEVEVGV